MINGPVKTNPRIGLMDSPELSFMIQRDAVEWELLTSIPTYKMKER